MITTEMLCVRRRPAAGYGTELNIAWRGGLTSTGNVSLCHTVILSSVVNGATSRLERTTHKIVVLSFASRKARIDTRNRRLNCPEGRGQ
jgi:hypothetical protein